MLSNLDILVLYVPWDNATHICTYLHTSDPTFTPIVYIARQGFGSVIWYLYIVRTECPKIYRQSVLHQLKHTANLYWRRCSRIVVNFWTLSKYSNWWQDSWYKVIWICRSTWVARYLWKSCRDGQNNKMAGYPGLMLEQISGKIWILILISGLVLDINKII